jgi:Neuraminidase (sialidase)
LNNLASRLRRGSSEWEPASPFWDGSDVNDHAPKLWWDGERTIFHFARGFAENIVRTSTDNGATWSKARIVLPHGEFGNGVVQIRGGTILVSHDMPFASLIASHDHGAIWMSVDATRGPSNFRSGGEGFRHAGIHAPVVQLADGRLMTIGRYDKPEDQERFGGKTPVSYSSDLGRTWRYEASEFPAISSAQRAVLIRLREGPLLLCSYTDQARDWKQRQGLPFKAIDGSQFTGYGLFAAVSFDDGRTWPARRLITPGARQRTEPTIDAGTFILSETMAEPSGYLAATQSRDGLVQLLSSKNHYVFNLAWLKSLPPPPEK